MNEMLSFCEFNQVTASGAVMRTSQQHTDYKYIIPEIASILTSGIRKEMTA